MKRIEIIAIIAFIIILAGGGFMALRGQEQRSAASSIEEAVARNNSESYLSMRMSDIVTTKRPMEIKKPELIVDIPDDLLDEPQLPPRDVIEEALGAPAPTTEPTLQPVIEPAPVVPDGSKQKIVIIIDDMGQDRIHTKQTVALPGPLTLSYLPYSDDILPQVAQGRAAGHEIMLHMPMQPVADTSLGRAPYVLRVDMDDDTLKTVFEKNMAAFDGYVGINNHMGSRLTQDRRAMNIVMEDLRRRGLFFVDSLTIGSSIAGRVASEYGVPHATRDVFLDDDPSLDNVRSALRQLERHARTHGVAIAIGHPKKDTIAALKEWLPTLDSKGFVLVPASQVVKTVPVSTTQVTSPSAAEPAGIDLSPAQPLE